MKKLLTAVTLAASMATLAQADDDKIVVGFAVASSGFMTAYDQPAANSAKIRIKEINESGGLLGKQIEIVEFDTKSDRALSAKATLQAMDAGAEMMVMTGDYDMGAAGALTAEQAGLNSFFLTAEDIKAGIQGVGPNSFAPGVLAPVQSAAIAEWAYTKKDARTAYVLLDTTLEYNKGLCASFEWKWAQLEGATIVGKDTFKNADASIASQVTRIKSLPDQPDVIMVCSYIPGAASAFKQLRAAGIDGAILNGSAVDGAYWLESVPGLSNFYVPVMASVYGDDPRPAVNEFNKTYEEFTGSPPVTVYTYPGYILIDVWAKAVERAGTTEATAVTAELEKMRDEETIFGKRTFTDELHHQNTGTMQIIEIKDGKPGWIDSWTLSAPIPLDVLLAK